MCAFLCFGLSHMRDVLFVRCGPQPYFDSNKGYTEVRGSAISAHVNSDTH